MKYDRVRKEEFEHVAMPHTESLLRAALRITRDHATAEDIVQQTLLYAWRAFDQFERGTNCKAWLFRILLNLASKQRRKIRAMPVMLTLSESQQVVQLQGASQVTATDVLSALDALSVEHRIILMLAAIEGFSCKEIAQVCALPIGTVLSRLSRARAALRKQLTAEQGARSSANAM